MTFRDVLGGGPAEGVPWHPHDGADISGEIVASTIKAERFLGGTITGKEFIIAGGVDGIIRSDNFVSGSAGWRIRGDGNAEFNNVVIRGDIESGNWDGASPANLGSSPDSTATAGFYLDSSAGTAQFVKQIWLGTAAGDRMQVDPGSFQGIRFWDSATPDTEFGDLSPGTRNVTLQPPQDSDTFDDATKGFIQLNAKGTNPTGISLVLSQVAGASPTGTAFKNVVKITHSAAFLQGAITDATLRVDALTDASTHDDAFVATRVLEVTPFTETELFRIKGSGQTLHAFGSVGAPSLSFLGDNNTGMFRVAADIIGWATAGVERFRMSTAYLFSNTGDSAPAIKASEGTSSLPAYTFTNDTDTGMFRNGANSLAFATAGGLRFSISATNVEPHGDNALNLGTSGGRWVDVWAVDNTINTSDARAKKFRGKLRFDSIEFLHALPASQFKRRGRKRWHTGFTSQDIKQALDSMGMDLAVYIEPENKEPLGMRIGELVPILWDVVQKVEQRVAALEAAA